MLLNKKQVMVGWLMIFLVVTAILYAIFTLPEEPHSIKAFHYFYFFVLILGFVLVYVLRDKKK